MLGRMLEFFLARAGGNPLEYLFYHHQGRLIDKWQHYFEVYHRHFARFRRRKPVVMEIGVYHGGSLQLWKKYFGPGARIIGVDIDPRCQAFAEDSIEIAIGDQSDRAFHAELRRRYPHVDILIDDGGHTMQQQIVTLEEQLRHVQPHGVYLCEDLHTSYASLYGGGYRKDGSFIERAKSLVDSLHGYFAGLPSVDPALRVDDYTRSMHSIHFYDSVVVIEKRPTSPPKQVTVGKRSYLP
jgi:methyltransferase family protein